MAQGGKVADVLDDLLEAVGLYDEAAAVRDGGAAESGMARGDDDSDPGPVGARVLGELHSVHGAAGHLHIGEQGADRRGIGFDGGNGLIGVRGLQHLEPGIAEGFKRVGADQVFILGKNDERRSGGAFWVG